MGTRPGEVAPVDPNKSEGEIKNGIGNTEASKKCQQHSKVHTISAKANVGD